MSAGDLFDLFNLLAGSALLALAFGWKVGLAAFFLALYLKPRDS
jgi:hypothetical protein